MTFQKITKADVPMLYDMALRAFKPDYEKYGIYPPLLKTKSQRFLPPLSFGKKVVTGGAVIGVVFTIITGRSGLLGSIFIDPAHQKKGYGRQVMLAVEAEYPTVRKWKLDTPGENFHLHRFYESLGYVKTGEAKDKKTGFTTFIYEKTMQ